MTFTWTWYDANNTPYDLTGQVDSQTLWGMKGFGMPPVKMIEDLIPEHDGSMLRDVVFGVRELELPLVFMGTSQSDIFTKQRAWLSRFNPKRGNGKLRIVLPDGAQREIVCRMSEGYEGDLRTSTAGPLFRKFVAVFRCADPYFRATSATIASYLLGATPATFFPFFPLRLTNSTLFAAPTATNSGDATSEPIWTITGPGSAITLRNLTSDKILTTSRALLAGESLVIDTRFGIKSITDNTGSNEFDTLSSDSEFWLLETGTNNLEIEMSGTTAASSVVLSYTPRYLGI